VSGPGLPSPASPPGDPGDVRHGPGGAPGGPADVRYDAAGLVPVVVQDVADGRVLMLAWANAEAVAATLATGEVHFFSRTRAALWRKGETSGHFLRLVDLALDCDGDALLARVVPVGPTCHRGERSCFDPGEGGQSDEGGDEARRAPGEGAAPWSAESGEVAAAAASCCSGGSRAEADDAQGFAWLETLWSTIIDRAARRPEGSYTARLLAAGVDGPARKVTEEATEVLMAAKDDAAGEAAGADRAVTREALAGEVADLVYHALVLLAERGVQPATVLERLRSRHEG
jgi:phosphoribosyl-ATP pyrophosphohydrolase/phosphoribosyl-AMP cyclohydrolase